MVMHAPLNAVRLYMRGNSVLQRLQRLANKVFFIVLEKNNGFAEYSAQIRSKTGFASEFDPQTHSEIE